MSTSEEERAHVLDGDVPVAPAPPPPEPEGSLLGALRAQREKAQAAQTLTLPVPGWMTENGIGLSIRFHMLKWAQTGPILKRQMESDDVNPMATLIAACDFLIRSCDEVLAISADGEQHALLPSEEPAKLDDATCVALGLGEPKNARDAVVRIYLGREQAIVSHYGRLQAWMQGLLSETSEAMLGES